MSWTVSGLGRAPVLFQIAGTPTVAYSLRQLDLIDKTVVRVRRSSDNAEQDFTATQVTDGTLTTFCGAGNGFVRTWYDQSGNNQHLTQTTTGSQPQIVSSGAVVTVSSKPSMTFDGSDDRLFNSSVSVAQPDTIFMVVKQNSIQTANRDIFLDSYNNVQHYIGYEGDVGVATTRVAASAVPTVTTVYASINPSLYSALYNGSNSFLYANNSAVFSSSGVGGNGLSGLSVGDIRGNPNVLIGGYGHAGQISELIIYASDQTSKRIAIQNNINAHFAVY